MKFHISSSQLGKKDVLGRKVNRAASDLVSWLFLSLTWTKNAMKCARVYTVYGPVLEFGLSVMLRQSMSGGFVPLPSEERHGPCARSG